MKKLILIACLSSVLGGCAILSPWKAPTSCSDTSNNGAACASVESNLEYSIKQGDTPTEKVTEVPITEHYTIEAPEFENDQFVSKPAKPLLKKQSAAPLNANAAHNEDSVTKDELGRLFIEMAIDSSVTKKPTFIPAATYRVLIYPYSIGNKYYSSRYVYITAGKPRWVTGNIVSDGARMIKVSVPAAPEKKNNVKQTIETMTLKKPPHIQEIPKSNITTTPKKHVKHRVSAYLLNCRDMPSIEGNSIAVFEQDRILDITDKSLDWWKVSFYEIGCYVNSSYLYSEPEQ